MAFQKIVLNINSCRVFKHKPVGLELDKRLKVPHPGFERLSPSISYNVP